MAGDTISAARLRLLRFLSKGEAKRREAAAGERVLLDGGDRGTIAVNAAELQACRDAGHVEEQDGVVHIRPAGRAALRQGQTSGVFRPQRQEPAAAFVETTTGREAVTIDEAESPLAMLWRRKTGNGGRFLSASEFRAGERLRSDYSRGMLMPRLGVNWDMAGATGGRQGGPGGMAELTEAALSARNRVEKAIAAVGPELAGVLVDVCCFLKGLERVEAERGWPARSAKVVLKSALGALARHYEPPARKSGVGRAILHWGAADYRPSLG